MHKRMIMIPPTIPQIHPQELIACQNTPTPTITNAARTTSPPANLIRPFHVLRSKGSSSGGSLMDVPHEVQNCASIEFRPLHFGHSIGKFYHDDNKPYTSHAVQAAPLACGIPLTGYNGVRVLHKARSPMGD